MSANDHNDYRGQSHGQYDDNVIMMQAYMPPHKINTKYSHATVEEASPKKKTTLQDGPSRTQIVCRSLGLQLIYNLVSRIFQKQNQTEERKIAMQKNRSFAILRCTIHIFPVAAAIYLVALNGTTYYVGKELAGVPNQDTQKLAGLQFAAKIHELLMLASLTIIVFAFIRREMTMGDGVPFGAVFAGLQTTSISYLWSVEFWSVIMNEWSRRRKKYSLVALLLLSTILGVSVGPSTAVLMRPRLDWWDAGGTAFWMNGTTQEVFPTEVGLSQSSSSCAVDTGDLTCPHGQWRMLTDQYFSLWPYMNTLTVMPQNVFLSGRTVRSQMSITTLLPTLLYSNQRALATLPIVALSEVIGWLGTLWVIGSVRVEPRLLSRRDTLFSVNTTQPAVEALCLNSTDTFLNDSTYLPFPDVAAKRFNGSGILPQGQSEMTLVGLENYGQALADEIRNAWNSSKWIFINDSGIATATNSSVNVIATVPSGIENTTHYFACSIDARWSNSTSYWTGTPRIIQGDVKGAWSDDGFLALGGQRINIDPEWMQLLNAQVDNNTTIYESILSRAWSASNQAAQPGLVESIFALLVANGLSRMSWFTNIAGIPRGWDYNDSTGQGGIAWVNEKNSWGWSILPRGKMNDGLGVYDLSDGDKARLAPFQFNVYKYGYAYSWRGSTQIIALAVLCLYATLAVCHVAYSAITGWTSTSWDSAPEIAALAMQSDRSRELDNTGAGIITMGVHEQNVKIRVHEDGHQLQYVFRDTIREEHSRVVKNRTYA